ncbi:hypothetical protein [Streptomyces yanii]|uniref:hypothetical protein n=1 Tax=Streptomyces yanii TaxID=78510 RepID=UPI0031EE686E
MNWDTSCSTAATSPRGQKPTAAADAFRVPAFLISNAHGILAQRQQRQRRTHFKSAKARCGVSAMAFSYRLRTMNCSLKGVFSKRPKATGNSSDTEK